MTDATPHTYDHARQTTKEFARTFYFASHVLPRDKRDAAYSVYAFCRHADNLADVRQASTVPPDARLSEVRDLVVEYTTTACRALEALPPSSARDRLEELALSLLHRRQ